MTLPDHETFERKVRIVEMQAEARKLIPEVHLVDRHPRGFEMQILVRVDFDYDFAPTHERGMDILRDMAAEFQLKAIRYLGVQPMIDAYRKDAEQARRESTRLSEQLAVAHQRIGRMQAEIDNLCEEKV